MSSFKKVNKKTDNFRRKFRTTESDDDISAPSNSSHKTKASTNEPPVEQRPATEKTNLPATRSLVSFNLEEDADASSTFTIKKSTQSRKIAEQLRKSTILSKEAEQERRRKEAVEKLNVLRQEMKQMAGSESEKEEQSDNENRDRDVDHNEKRVSPDRARSENSESSAGESRESEDRHDDSRHIFTAGQRTQTKAASFGRLRSGQIPDALTIHEIRKKRQQMALQQTFIPLESKPASPGRSEIVKGQSKSRLVREDDNDLSDEENPEARLEMHLSHSERERSQLRKQFLSAEQGSDDERREGADSDGPDNDDDELHSWELQQINKAVGRGAFMQQRKAVESSAVVAANVQAATSEAGWSYYAAAAASAGNGFAEYYSEVAVGTAPTAARSAPPRQPNMAKGSIESLAAIRRSVQDKLNDVDASLNNSRQERQRIVESLQTSEQAIGELKRKMQPLDDRYQFYQQLRLYCCDLLDCLNEKMDQLSKLESQAMKVWQTRAKMLVDRRQQDIRDEVEDVLGTAPSIPAWSLQTPDADPTERKRRRAVEREGRRLRRRAARELSAKASPGALNYPLPSVGPPGSAPAWTSRCSDGQPDEHQEGDSSDDELEPADVSHLNKLTDEVKTKCGQLFQDTIEDYSQFSNVVDEFSKWRTLYADDFAKAYGQLCVSQISTVFIRIALVLWQPLQPKAAKLDDMNWFRLLARFCAEHIEETHTSRVIPMALENALLNRLCELIRTVWDPFSSSDTARLVELLKFLITTLPTFSGDSDHLASVIKAILGRLRASVEQDIYIPMMPASVWQDLSSARSMQCLRLLQRQFFGCAKLLRSCVQFEFVVSRPVLQDLALTCVLNRYLLLAMNQFVAAQLVAPFLVGVDRVVTCLPGDWLRSDLLAPLRRLLKQALAKQLVSPVRVSNYLNLIKPRGVD